MYTAVEFLTIQGLCSFDVFQGSGEKTLKKRFFDNKLLRL